jgi:hypothetical protein
MRWNAAACEPDPVTGESHGPPRRVTVYGDPPDKVGFAASAARGEKLGRERPAAGLL